MEWAIFAVGLFLGLIIGGATRQQVWEKQLLDRLHDVAKGLPANESYCLSFNIYHSKDDGDDGGDEEDTPDPFDLKNRNRSRECLN